MADYVAPVRDHLFFLEHVMGHSRLSRINSNLTPDLVQTILESAGSLAAGSFAPLNRSGDKQGAQLTPHGVVVPKGFKEAYHDYVQGGWNALPFAEEWGGQGLPPLLMLPVQEMLQSANISLALVTLLNEGATSLLAEHGDDNLKKTYLPKMVSGAWTGTMNLTEPQAGSDLSAIRCRAEPHGDAYKIMGQKIFISYGEHDLTENIIHFVLARLPDAPEGIKGISLFLVPRVLPNGTPNDVRAVSLEHKLGLHGSPTCVMSFGDNGGATGYLVGRANAGIPAMFTMMNHARLGVAVQGLGLAERAMQDAVDYARTRVQGGGSIIQHADIRRMLLLMQAKIMAGRALLYQAYYALSTKHQGYGHEREKLVDWLTPLCKAWLTDQANIITSECIQVFGGMGYIEETGVAQHYRDARVLAIYEGTNGIQAADLVNRKLLKDTGTTQRHWAKSIRALAEQCGHLEGASFIGMTHQLNSALECQRLASDWLISSRETEAIAAAAHDYLQMTSIVAAGAALIEAAIAARQKPDDAYHQKIILLAETFASYEMPMTVTHLHRIMQASHLPLALKPEAF
ncbi:MAG: acyl-CoA dehydrogenase [Alphaproteobacteria bacterium]|nr:acyl-CoA dehydrogenase [Alphaproteobacteria bacterium]NDC56157.1 acyl-CoA dehydrogenase [Alphaproteobacteria bacterium]NDG04664.1 acyl-CoA dehydrogenase [Alphaproteobacteria bacterium]